MSNHNGNDQQELAYSKPENANNDKHQQKKKPLTAFVEVEVDGPTNGKEVKLNPNCSTVEEHATFLLGKINEKRGSVVGLQLNGPVAIAEVLEGRVILMDHNVPLEMDSIYTFKFKLVTEVKEEKNGENEAELIEELITQMAQLAEEKEEMKKKHVEIVQEFTGTLDRAFRVIMCGNVSVGKTSIIMRIVKGAAAFHQTIPTFCPFFHMKKVRIGMQNVAVQLWDTAGQERFHSLSNSYFRRADGVILVYDCSARSSFLHIRDYWIETIKDLTMKDVPILLVANKVELRNAPGTQETASNFVSREEGENLAELLDIDFIEVSAIEGTNVETALLLLVGEMIKSEECQLNQTVDLILPNANRKKGCTSCGSS